MRKLPWVETEEARAVCAACGGKCCKRIPGNAYPEDFAPNVEKNLREAIASGLWAIDCWEGDLDDTYDPMYVRPQTKKGHMERRLFDRSWGGECVFFHENVGCVLPFEKRPKECRMLEPRKGGGCFDHCGDKANAARHWRTYQRLLKEIVREGEDR